MLIERQSLEVKKEIELIKIKMRKRIRKKKQHVELIYGSTTEFFMFKMKFR